MEQQTESERGTGVYQSRCPDCGSFNLTSVTVRIDPKTKAPLRKHSILRASAAAILCLTIGLAVFVVMSISGLDEGMGVGGEGFWMIGLPIACVNLFALAVLIAGAYFAVNGLIAALHKSNGYLRTCTVCGKQWI